MVQPFYYSNIYKSFPADCSISKNLLLSRQSKEIIDTLITFLNTYKQLIFFHDFYVLPIWPIGYFFIKYFTLFIQYLPCSISFIYVMPHLFIINIMFPS